MKQQLLFATVSVLGLGLTGCTVQSQRPVYSGPGMGTKPAAAMMQADDMAMNAMAGAPEEAGAGYQAAVPQNTAMLEKLAADMNALYQRMQRAERAMIRLDRRMQLIERNELGRMGANDLSGTEPAAQQLGSLQTPVEPMRQMAALGPVNQIPPSANPYPAGVTPVVASLQPAPQQMQGQQLASLNKSHLPSLADEGSNPQADPSMAVWTVRYVNGKIWPDRNQLPASREVVSTLRSGKPVALFARGAHPNSKEFRERVRALSRYLSKVSESNNVAISAMPAQHLDADTIEIFATR